VASSSKTWSTRLAQSLGLLLGTACGSTLPTQVQPEQPLWSDPDQRPFSPKPAEYYSPFTWDAADQTLFRPLTRLFAVDPGGESANVNAFDEVPDSSWFTNRSGRYAMSPEQVAEAACQTPPLSTSVPWWVTGAKPDGFNPGFILRGPDDRRYLVKFDGTVQGPRATAADVIGSRIYHAAGFFVPCNRIVHFDRAIVRIADGAKAEESGKKVPLTQAHLEKTFRKALRLPDGRYRASLSLFVTGEPLGPWRYQDVRDDDPNDVIPHEDRRELRGARLLAAWLSHFDAREQNTLATFIRLGSGQGYVRHHVIDFGDCLGSLWEPPMLGRRIGHAYYLDVGHVFEDLITLGAVQRPWDQARFGPSGSVFAYFDVDLFDPEAWRPGYPNPAFARMTERDAAWMARIVASFDEADLRAVLAAASLSEPLAQDLLRILLGRRRKILERYLTRLSALSFPEVLPGDVLCLRDLAVTSGLRSASERRYRAVARNAHGQPSALAVLPQAEGVCVKLPSPDGTPDRWSASVDVTTGEAGAPTESVACVHLSPLADRHYQVRALERLDPGKQ
jgi:hypothetical protein